MAERVEKLKGKALDALQGGPEPDFTQKDVCGFVRALNWYSNIKAYKDSKVYTLAYLKQHKYDSKIINLNVKIYNYGARPRSSRLIFSRFLNQATFL